MSQIDKLSILGIRSFDNTRSETIQFHAPLTLIVGYNGSGKTTIIECLKYATTGEQPPNSRGGAFIHDPKLCGEKEVLAQVKLSFRSTTGARIIATRSLQLTVKKATRSMKTLDGSVKMMRNGETTTLSQRVAEIDSIMPKYLGVSKAILDSVIFCHQDESLWPMSEPSALKKRFDEIFEALKYTKAIDNIKVLAKTQKVELGKLKIIEQHAKEDKDKGERIEKRSTEVTDQMDELRMQSTEVGQKIANGSRKADEVWKLAQAAGMITGRLEGKRIERRTKEESVQSLRQDLNEMSDSDEQLQILSDQFEERVQTSEHELVSQKSRHAELEDDVKEARQRVSAKERECGSYEAQKESYDRQIEGREKLVKETARSHGIRGCNLEIDDEQVRAFMDHITKMAKEQNTKFEQARRETQEDLQKAQKALNHINEQKSALNQRKESSRTSVVTNDRKIGTLQSDLNKINMDEGGKVALESSLVDTERRLGTTKSNFETADWDKKVDFAESELRKLDDRKEKLDVELVEGTRQAGDSARLDFVQKELKDRQRSLDTMTGAHGEKIAAIVGDGWQPAKLETDFQRSLQQSSEQLTESERQRDGVSRELEQLDYKLNNCRSDLKAKNQEIKDCATKIRDAVDCEPEDYFDEVKKLEVSRDVLKSDKDTYGRMENYFLKCLETAKRDNACMTCKRGFKTKETDIFIQAMQKEIKANASRQMEEDLNTADMDLKAAKAVSTSFETWERLKHKEIPALETDQAKLDTRRDALLAQVDEQDRIVNEHQAAKRDIESLSRTVQNIAKYNTDIKNFEGQIKELSAKQKAAGLSRGLESIQEDIKKVNDESRTVKANLSRMTSDRDRARNLINSLELEVRDIKSKLSTALYQLKEKTSLETQIEDLKSLNAEQRDSMRSIDQDLQGLVPQLSQAQAKYDDIARRGADKDRALQSDLTKLNASLQQLKMADREITSYVDRGGPQQLVRGKREADNLKAEVTRVEQEQQRIVKEVKMLEDRLRSHSEQKRTISDNQRYRRDLRQLQTVRAEIEELESHNAEEDKARYDRELRRWEIESKKLSAEQATIVGQLKTKDEMLKQLLKDWDTDYKDAAYKYKEAHIKVETTKAAVEDLGRYGGALDKAIMKYHSLKMEEINRIIEELWRKTYQGTDVDTILIRSESEAVKSNKSYNYRVCMVKQDAEMDMRGRCSAGQKVLASIIIRLALAECFGVNCGLIALDEPTTNLDRDNIRALAESLSEIIKVRRQQKNFQLIVITHDEEFLRYMNCQDFADVYYRVSRNAQQKSEIHRESIAEVC